MNGKPEEIVSILKEEISQYEQKTQVSETGSVVQVGDGIATVYGLENVMYGELLEFENGVRALAMNLETTAPDGAANRAASSKPARFFRRWRRFAGFPL